MPPIKPAEAIKAKIKAIPEEVFEIWNKIIVESLSGTSANIKAHVVSKAIAKAMNVTEDHVYDAGWMDIEPLYRKAGWEVTYDRPGYNETYDAYYVFSKKRS